MSRRARQLRPADHQIRLPLTLPPQRHARPRTVTTTANQPNPTSLQLAPFSAVAAVLCAAVPTAKTLFILSSEYETGRELVAATIALTTLASVASLLAWLVLLARLYPSVFRTLPG